MSLFDLLTDQIAQNRLLRRLKVEINKLRKSARHPPNDGQLKLRSIAYERLSQEDFDRFMMALENFLPPLHPDDLQALLLAIRRRRLAKIFRETGNHDTT
ncbi:MAG: hypothetical protein WA001_03670 [Patescibacteria group bacterium]